MAQKKSYSGMSGGEPLSSLRDVHIPSNALPGAALSITSTGEFGILDYSQDYFTAKALEVIPPMGAVKMGPGGVLPRTSAVEPESPVIGVSVAGAAAGEDALVLRSGKIAGKVFSPVNSVLRTLVGGTVGVAAAGTIVGTVDSDGVGYVSIGSAAGGGGGSAAVSAAPGNIISEKPDGLFAKASGGSSDAEYWLSQNPDKTLDDYLELCVTDNRFFARGDIVRAKKGIGHPGLLSMVDYNLLPKFGNDDIIKKTGDWRYKYLQDRCAHTIPKMTSNTEPSPMRATASGVNGDANAFGAFRAFDNNSASTNWHSANVTWSWVSVDFGEELALESISVTNRHDNATTFVGTVWRVELKSGTGDVLATIDVPVVNKGVLGVNSLDFKAGTRVDKNATIGNIQGVRYAKISGNGSYSVINDVSFVAYKGSIPEDSEFVTPAIPSDDADFEYYLCLSQVCVTSAGEVYVKEMGSEYYIKGDKGDSKSDAEYWLGQNPGKTMEDYYELYGGIVPVSNLVLGGQPVRTCEKRNGKWVYKKLINTGKLPAAAGSTTYPHNVVGADNIWLDEANTTIMQIGGSQSYGPYYAINTTGYVTSYVNSTVVGITVGTNWSAYEYIACVAYTLASEVANNEVLGVDVLGNQIVKGDDGESAYELAVRLGFSGTESEWQASLQGRDRNGVADDDANLALIRETRAGEIIYWPSSTIPILLDGLPKGLPVSGGIASLVTYPRLDRVLCIPEYNSWAPAWFRCDDNGARNISGLFIQLDDWRGGYPQIMDNGRNNISNYLVVNITAGSNKLVLVNNMSVGTLLTPSTSLEGVYPGMRLAHPNLAAGTTVVSADSTGIYIDKPAVTAGSRIWVTSYGRMLGGWQGDAGRRIESSLHIPMNNAGCWVTVYEPRYINYYISAYANGTGYIGGLDTARVVPTSPEYRPKGPVTNAIILV